MSDLLHHPVLGPVRPSPEDILARLEKLEAVLSAKPPANLARAIANADRASKVYGAYLHPEDIATLLEAAKELARVTAPLEGA